MIFWLPGLKMCVCALLSANDALARLKRHPGLWLHFPLQAGEVTDVWTMSSGSRPWSTCLPSDWKCIAKCHPKVSALLDLAHSTPKRKINFIALPQPLPWIQKVNSSLNGSFVFFLKEIHFPGKLFTSFWWLSGFSTSSERAVIDPFWLVMLQWQ